MYPKRNQSRAWAPVLISALGTLIMFWSNIALAANEKLNVCHIPPSDPYNFHTVTIGEKALAAHQGHGDLVGPCDGLCATLCDDGDACTIDDRADCESAGCPVIRETVDCDDSNACTVDSCNPLDGVCINEVVVVCEASDLCHVATCDPLTGECAETEKLCAAGEVCNLDNGMCEPEGGPPVISSFAVQSISSATITLQWATNIPATTEIYFRLEDVGSFELGGLDPELVTEHLIVLPTPLGDGLLSNTNYELFARSESASGLSSDSDVILVRTRR